MSVELRITLTKENSEKVLALIKDLLEIEDGIDGSIQADIFRRKMTKEDHEESPIIKQDLLTLPTCSNDFAEPRLDTESDNGRARLVGSWGHFNSFFPVKAACRILVNLSIGRSDKKLKLDEFVNQSVLSFRLRRLNSYRGFPSSTKNTALGRYVLHFLLTANEMGFIRLTHASDDSREKPYSQGSWNAFSIEPTTIGFEFAQIPSDMFDKGSASQILSSEERDWLLGYLKSIDAKGYKEYSLLHDVYLFLDDGHDGKDDLRKWFVENNSFKEYIGTWSRKLKSGSSEEISVQMSNLANLFAASKVALLREFGLVDPKRNRYSVIGKWGGNNV